MLYHYQIGFPLFTIPTIKRIELSQHAQLRLQEKVGISPKELPRIKIENIIEMEINSGIVEKILFRNSFNNDYDICYVIRHKKGGHYIVATIWLNHKLDNHHTLDRSKYAKP